MTPWKCVQSDMAHLCLLVAILWRISMAARVIGMREALADDYFSPNLTAQFDAVPGMCDATGGILNEAQEDVVMACLADAIYQVHWNNTKVPFGKWERLALDTIPDSHDKDYIGIYGRFDEKTSKWTCALAISGTNSLRDMQTNLAYTPNNILFREKCALFGYDRVHGGFANKALTIMNHMNEHGKLKEMYNILQNPKRCNRAAYLVGHSQGGALATLLAGCNSIDNQLFKLEKLYTFGAPRISADVPLMYYIDGERTCFPGYRIFNQNEEYTDLVPTLPPSQLHPLMAIKTWTDSNTPVTYTCADHPSGNEKRTRAISVHSMRELIPKLRSKKAKAD